MGYMDLLGAYRGEGKGVGPGVDPEEAQGGPAGFARAAKVGMKGVGAGLMTSSPRLHSALQAQDRAQYGAYHDMMSDQKQQDYSASRTTGARSILGGLEAVRQQLKQSMKTGTDMPGTSDTSFL